MKKALSTLTLLVALAASVHAQDQGFDYAANHEHTQTAVKTLTWVRRSFAPSAVPFRFNFLGNRLHLQDAAGRELTLYYDFDRIGQAADNAVLISTLEGKRVRVTYDPECGMVLNIAPAPNFRLDTLPAPKPPQPKNPKKGRGGKS